VVKIASERQAAIEIDILLRIGDAFYALGDMMESARALETAADRAGAAGLKLETGSYIECSGTNDCVHGCRSRT
jgi:hypothetical protein